MIDYTKKLNFAEEPKYNILRKLLGQALANEGIKLSGNDEYCWEIVSKKAEEKKEE